MRGEISAVRDDSGYSDDLINELESRESGESGESRESGESGESGAASLLDTLDMDCPLAASQHCVDQPSTGPSPGRGDVVSLHTARYRSLLKHVLYRFVSTKTLPR